MLYVTPEFTAVASDWLKELHSKVGKCPTVGPHIIVRSYTVKLVSVPPSALTSLYGAAVTNRAYSSRHPRRRYIYQSLINEIVSGGW